MKVYLISLCCTAAAASLACMLTVDDGKSVKFVASVCMLAAFIMPLGSVIGELDLSGIFPEQESDGDTYSEIFDNRRVEISRENVEKSVRDKLTSEMGIPNGNFDVYADIYIDGDGKLGVSLITVTLRGGAVFSDPRRIQKICADLFSCECRVVID